MNAPEIVHASGVARVASLGGKVGCGQDGGDKNDVAPESN